MDLTRSSILNSGCLSATPSRWSPTFLEEGGAGLSLDLGYRSSAAGRNARTQAAAELDALAKRAAIAYPASDKGNHFSVMDSAACFRRMTSRSLGSFWARLRSLLCSCSASPAPMSRICCLPRHQAGKREMVVVAGAFMPVGVSWCARCLPKAPYLRWQEGCSASRSRFGRHPLCPPFMFLAPVPLDISLTQDWRVSPYTFVLSLVRGTIVRDEASAWAVSRPLLTNALKGEDALAWPGRRWSLRSLLVIAQVAMSLVLLCATGLFLQQPAECGQH